MPVVRLVNYAVRQDPLGEVEYAALCVYGQEAECGATSGPQDCPSAVEEWMHKHTRETRHSRYQRTWSDFVVWEPKEEVPPPLEPARVDRVPR
jgi:hypothetical protein